MLLPDLEFGSLLSYASHGNSASAQHSRDIMLTLKRDGFFQILPNTQILASDWVAQTIQRNRSTLPFASFFLPNTILVPTPKSSLMRPGTLWVPLRLATSLVQCGLGKGVARVLNRVRPVRKSAWSIPENRPLPQEHYDSMDAQKLLPEPDNILLIDDIVTRGATLLGAASRLATAFPKTKICAFAVMRAITNESDFDEEYSPVVGKISLRSQGDTLRRP